MGPDSTHPDGMTVYCVLPAGALFGARLSTLPCCVLAQTLAVPNEVVCVQARNDERTVADQRVQFMPVMSQQA